MLLDSINDNIKGFKALALAVSGGRDSMAMLNYFASIRDKFDKLIVVNVEHGIRGESSVADSLFVEKAAKQLNIKYTCFREDIPKFCKENGYTEEQGARIRRREIFCQLVDEGVVERVVTAHYKSDQAESVLMHIFRGSGLVGLRGITVDDGKLLRPMLDVTREELDEYVKEHQILYVTDATNNSTVYTRNKLRLDIIPQIVKVYPGIESNVCKMAKNASEAFEYIQTILPELRVVNGSVRLPKEIMEKKDIISKYTLFKGLDLLDKRVDVEETHIEAVLDLLDKQRGSEIHLPHNLKAIKESDIILSVEEEINNEEYDFALGVFEVNGFSFSINTDSGDLRFDLNRMDKGARIRVRKDGDRFRSFKGASKSLGDYLTDKKVENHIKNIMPVIASGNEVLIIPTLEIADRVKVDERTKNIGYIRVIRSK